MNKDVQKELKTEKNKIPDSVVEFRDRLLFPFAKDTFNPAVVTLEDNTGGGRVSCCQSTHGNGSKQSRQR